MLAIGFVPNRVNVDARLTRIQDSLELGPTLVREPVSGAEGVFFDFHRKKWLHAGGRLRDRGPGYAQRLATLPGTKQIWSYHLTIR
jgi:hypothetical protein